VQFVQPDFGLAVLPVDDNDEEIKL
jgi:hypothetical protein